MVRIVWQAKSRTMLESFRNNVLSPTADGGGSYEYQAAKALAERHEIWPDLASVRAPGQSLPAYILQLNRSAVVADLAIKQPFPVIFGRRSFPVEVGMIHHVDTDLEQHSFQHRAFNALLRHRLKSLNAIVTVSEYWRRYLEAAGCPNVHVIFNSFVQQDYAIREDEVGAFLERTDLPCDRPIIYIGNAAARKGVLDAYQALKELDYTLVTSGNRANRAPDIPVRFFSLLHRDYLCLLKACDAAVTFSRMPEGWNRVAHEALLLGTPVVGSRSAGMRELLEGGGQLIAEDVGQIPTLVARALDERRALAARGLSFVRQFDEAYWRKAWYDLIEDVMH